MTSISYTEAVDFVENRQLKRCIDVSPLHVAAYVRVVVVTAAVSQPIDHPGIGVEIKNDRLIEREQAVKIAIGQAMWMIRSRAGA